MASSVAAAGAQPSQRASDSVLGTSGHAAVARANENIPRNKRQHDGNHFKPRKQTRRKAKAVKEGSAEEVLLAEVQAMLASQSLEDENSSTGAHDTAASDKAPLPEPQSEIEVTVASLSSTGDGIAHAAGSQHIYVVPFVVPGDKALIRVVRHNYLPSADRTSTPAYTTADLVKVVSPSPSRDNSLIRCRYFGTCSGCQFQMLPYEQQLAIKRDVVVRAYQLFSNLAPELVPTVGETIGSPLQYGYRTKLTPHFDGPPGSQFRRKRRKDQIVTLSECPPIGFTPRGKRQGVLDIEECPIGTEAVVKGLHRERARMAREFGNYSRGATILLRESTKRVVKGAGPEEEPAEARDENVVRVDDEQNRWTDYKVCITDNNATATEYVNGSGSGMEGEKDFYVFQNSAGAFFQNNNSILPLVTRYIREQIVNPPPDASGKEYPPVKHLIDAYSGSGLFTVTLSDLFETSTGIDIAASSIDCARENARLNGLVSAPDPLAKGSSRSRSRSSSPSVPPQTVNRDGQSASKAKTHCTFLAADAAHLFSVIPRDTTDPAATVVVIDPPRKGCDASFLRQLREFGPRRIVYVSCNVHTQARDVGVLVGGESNEQPEAEGGGSGGADAEAATASAEKKTLARYEIESIRGFDFFPQTAHVESVAVLRRVYE